EATESGGTSTISFMWWGNETRNAATINAVESFMGENPDVQVTSMPNPFQGYHDKILVQLANGTAPDLFCYSTEWMSEVGFEQNPLLLDLNTMGEYIDLTSIDSGVLSGGEANGKLLGVPTAISGLSFAYYSNAIDAYTKKTGNPAPPTVGDTWTWAGFLQYGKEFHEAMGDGYYFFEFGGDYSGFDNTFCWILSEIAGSPYLDEKCNVTFSEDELKQTFDTLVYMTENGIMPDADYQVEVLSGVNSRDTILAEGKLGSVLHWTSNIQENTVKAGAPMVTMAYPVLGEPTNDGVFVRPAQFWAIYSRSENKVAAARLLNYIVNSPTAALDLKLERGVPVTEIGRKTLSDAAILSGSISEATDYLVASADAGYNWFIRVPTVLNEINNSYVNVLLGKETSSSAAKRVYASIVKITDELRADYNI
ncbi:MAG: ABC transporter substrate-binding protein, partial [Sphaerochaetaceae bacterium]